jgi:hypothetical protein
VPIRRCARDHFGTNNRLCTRAIINHHILPKQWGHPFRYHARRDIG